MTATLDIKRDIKYREISPDMSSFRTKRGRCHLDGGTLRLEGSTAGTLRRYWEASTLAFALYAGAVVAGLGAFGWLLLVADGYTLALLGGAVSGGLAVYLLQRLRGFTRATEIPLESVERVSAVEGALGLTTPRFVVTYEADGKRRRYVTMAPRWIPGSEGDFQRGRDAFAEAGIPVEDR